MDIILIPGLWLDGSSWDEVIPVAGARRDIAPTRSRCPAWSRTTPTGRRSPCATTSTPSSRRSTPSTRPTARSCWSATPPAPRSPTPRSTPGPTGSPASSTSAASRSATATPSPTGTRPRTARSRCRTGRPSRTRTSPTSTTKARAEFRERAVPSPEHVTRDPQQLSDERRYDVPVTVISTEFTSEMLRGWIDQGLAPVREFTKIREVEYVDLPTGHWPQFTRPDDLGQAILATVDRAASNGSAGSMSPSRHRRARSPRAAARRRRDRHRSSASSSSNARRWRGSAPGSTRPACRRPPRRRR